MKDDTTWEESFDRAFKTPGHKLYQRETIADEIKSFIRSLLLSEKNKAREESDKYTAYCECGDALERTKLYPGEAEYYCFGCDKHYKLEAARSGKV